MSAIDGYLCKGILKDVVEEGFSSDSGLTVRVAQTASQIAAIAEKKSRKRKRAGTNKGDDIQLETSSGVGMTESEFSQDQLGTVFDKDGKVLYEKDYVSQLDELEVEQMVSNNDDMDAKISEPV